MPLTLHVQLLGGFSLVYGDEPVTGVNTPRLQSLLAYLILHGDVPQLRQHVAFTFWPDATDLQARNNLRQILHQLRHALRVPSADHFLHMDSSTVHWQAGAPVGVDCDVDDFERTLAQATRAEANGDTSFVKSALLRASRLYRDDLLPSCYDDWIMPDRERLRKQCAQALKRLALLLEEEREYAAAILHAQRLIQFDALDEGAYLILMRLHALDHDPVAARRMYAQCAGTLRREMGIEPSPLLREAYERLLQANALGRDIRNPGAIPLVGRQSAWNQLLTAWRRAAGGEAHLALITGEAGIGKTRLAEELQSWANPQGIVTARTRSYAAEGSLTLAPVTEWLRSDAIRQSLHQLNDMWLTEVARLLTELLAERPDLPRPEPMTEAGQRQRFFEALARGVLSAPQPLLLLIDDLQWCDQETLEWLHFLLRFDPRARLLVVGTSRVEEVVPPHPLIQWLVHLRSEGHVTEIALEPLDAAETARLAAHIAKRELDDASATQLYHETEGNPLFVVETMRVTDVKVKDLTGVRGKDLSGLRLPPRVVAVISGRLAQLSPSAHELAGVAASVGRAFGLEMLAKVTDVSANSLVGVLDELWQRRIVRDLGANRFDFSHDKIRDVAYAELSPLKQRHWHLRVAQALEAIHAADLDPVSAQLAAHYEQAGMNELAITYYQRAAEVELRVFANQEAVGLINRGLSLLRTLADTPHRDEQELSMLTTLCAMIAATNSLQISGQLEALRRAQALSQKLGRQPTPTILKALAFNHIMRANFEESHLIGQQLLDLAEQSRDPLLIVEAHLLLGITHSWYGEFEMARAHLEQAILRYDPQHSHTHLALYAWDPKVVGLCRLAQDLWCLGYPDQARQAQQESLQLAQALGHPYSLGYTLFYDAMLENMLGRLDLVRGQVEAVIALSQEHHLAWWLRLANVLHGCVFAAGGQPLAGIAEMERGLAVLSEFGTPLNVPFLSAQLVQQYARSGQMERALELLANTFAMIDRTNDRWYEAEIHRVRGEVLLANRSDRQSVESAYCRAMAIAQKQQAKSFELRAATSLARLWQAQGKVTEAHDLLQPIYAWFTEGFDTHDLQDARALLEQLTIY